MKNIITEKHEYQVDEFHYHMNRTNNNLTFDHKIVVTVFFYCHCLFTFCTDLHKVPKIEK